MANVEVTLEQLRGMGRTDLGETGPFPIDQQRIDTFADATDDHQWIHVDPARAADGPFGTTIAHGYLTLSLVPALVHDLVRITDQGRGTNYGIERVRFPDVVPVGAQLRAKGELLSVKERPDGGVQWSVGIEVTVEGASRPCMVGEMIYLAYP